MKSFFASGYLKYIATCTGVAVTLGGAVCAATVIALNHRNSLGKGGLDSPGIPQVTVNTVEQAMLTTDDMGIVAAVNENLELEAQPELSYFSYRIKKGDMIGVIAEQYGVTQDTLISVNNIKSSRLIQIGQYLKIPSMPGILYTVREDGETIDTIAQKYEVDSIKCSSINKVDQTESLKAGTALFVPDAELDWITRQEINGDLFKKPIHGHYYTSSYFGWRVNPFDASRRTYHGGIDMACSSGTNIYAALDGTVTTAGWSDIYGNYVIVTHHSGYQSLYGHMSKITCKKGQHVGTSTVIGKVGSTGQSTGPHLHFTVYKNGRSVNPANLWG